MSFKALQLSERLNSREFQKVAYIYWTRRCLELLHERATLPREELEYLAEQAGEV